MAVTYIPFTPLTPEEQLELEAWRRRCDEEEALFNLVLYFLKEFAT